MMNTEQTAHFKNLFLALKENLLKNTLTNEETVFLGDEGDLAEQEIEGRLSRKLKGRETFYLKKINSALNRLDNGSFGTCEDCGADISEARLMARPTADLCINCKEEEERALEHVPYNRKSHTLGKTFAS
jgi:DnaK suppressor protein